MSGIVRRQLDPDQVGPEKLTASLRNDRYCFETFMNPPFCRVLAAGVAGVNASQLVSNLCNTGRYIFEYALLVDNTDGVNEPVLGSEGGYDWTTLGTDLADGVEINFGGSILKHPRNFIASAEDWFARILLVVDNASGADIIFGFKKVAAVVATLTEITDIIGVRILGDSSSTTGAFTIISNLNNGGTSDLVSTTPNKAPTPLEDAAAIELEVRSIGRVAHLYVNGIEQFGLTFTIDSGDTLAPTLRIAQTTDLFTQVKTLCYESGPIADRQPGSLLSLSGATT